MNTSPFDLRRYKKELRHRYKELRRSMDPQLKAKRDAAIYHRIRELRPYRNAHTLLCFVSTPTEVDTHLLLRQALAEGKTVAVPYCIHGTRDMEFYRIQSLEELKARTFGVLEPVADPANKLTEYSGSICLVPGLVFDRQGYRLGYGGGYYDRFLSGQYTGVTAGICYADHTLHRLVHGRYDIPCQWLVTDRFIRRIANKKQ